MQANCVENRDVTSVAQRFRAVAAPCLSKTLQPVKTLNSLIYIYIYIYIEKVTFQL